MTQLNEKVALVTGGSRGIGAAIAKRLAADRGSVAITYAKDPNAASDVVKAIEHEGGKALAIQADAADVEAVTGAVEKTVATLGRLDVLVNNAGTAIPKTFEETTLEEMDRVININVRGVLATTQASDRRDEEGQKLISEIRKMGAEAEFVHADARRKEDVRNLIDKTVERYDRLDVAVNAAGTEGVPGPVVEQTAGSYSATFDTNVLGTLLSMKHELRVMLPQKNGSIVNISSTYGQYRCAWGFCLFRE